jgi:hypothetical protein
LYSIGDRLGVVETELGLCRMGAQVIVSPSAWAVEADHDNAKEPYDKLWLDSYSELARLYDVSVMGVSTLERPLAWAKGDRLLARRRAGRWGTGERPLR